jgi:large subunit ribosomal protein L23
MSTIYDVLRRPLVTEKSSYQSGKLNQYSFIVADNATRQQVKDAIETLYDVSVVSVNIMNTPAKRGRRLRSRRLLVRKPGHKKAIVTLADGQTLQIFEGVQ